MNQRARAADGGPICGETDGLMEDETTPMFQCTRTRGHWEAIHREIRDGRLWAEWRQILPGSAWEAARAKRFPAKFGPNGYLARQSREEKK